MRAGFDNSEYITIQSKKIMERIDMFGGKLYLEFGGKLFDDYHASRVLPGFEPDSKIGMLMKLSGKTESIIVVSAGDLEKNKARGDLGITYDMEVLRSADMFRDCGIYVNAVVLTQYAGQHAAKKFEKRLKALGLRTYRHYHIDGYPLNIDNIVSESGFGKNDYVETERPLVLVTAPGPGSGKLAVCLSQLYHENIRGRSAGYAKFETFPVWDLPLKHPVNAAYEAATADLGDVNMIDPFHLEAYGKAAVNYNRDIEVFPIVNSMLTRILGTSPYMSPTDMGVNMVGSCITDNDAVSKASRLEIIRRYYDALKESKTGSAPAETVTRLELLMRNSGISASERKIIPAVRKRSDDHGIPVSGIELDDGTIVTGKNSPLLGASSAAILNALKTLADVDDDVLLMSPGIIGPIGHLKLGLGFTDPELHVDEMLIALSICAQTDAMAMTALEQLPRLKGCEMHSSVILDPADESMLRRIGLNITCEPKYRTNLLYQDRNR